LSSVKFVGTVLQVLRSHLLPENEITTAGPPKIWNTNHFIKAMWSNLKSLLLNSCICFSGIWGYFLGKTILDKSMIRAFVVLTIPTALELITHIWW